MANSDLKWPSLRFPPVNLWVMSAWQGMVHEQHRRRMRNPQKAEKLRHRFLALLAERGGKYGH
ncbi:MAG: hypothetical protein ACE5F3_07700 [Mariprofundaceae bacterium]